MNRKTMFEGRSECYSGNFGCHITTFWELLWGPESATFYRAFHERNKNSDLIIGTWAKIEPGVIRRECKWVSPINAPIGPKSTRVSGVETTYILSEREMIIETASTTHDVPYGETFKVEVRYHILSTPEGCSMKVYLRLVFQSFVLIKSILEAGAFRGTQEFCRVWTEVALEFLQRAGPDVKNPRTKTIKSFVDEEVKGDGATEGRKERKSVMKKGKEVKIAPSVTTEKEQEKSPIISAVSAPYAPPPLETPIMSAPPASYSQISVSTMVIGMIFVMLMTLMFFLPSYITLSSRLALVEHELAYVKAYQTILAKQAKESACSFPNLEKQVFHSMVNGENEVNSAKGETGGGTEE
eukprot:TRINITY_DN3985_c0_g1_i1.p1 TRINITY_DN3985_c0_g1~~TRINITY_DN3985_c0_g1_i1.p1  ORF type:complete len:354 (+),score=79.96 TRINITY_DN3985_c0_g1_i1:360-1421(+)